jgi:hypothetical protein
MNDQTNTKQYRWPDLSAVIRQAVVRDDQGRYGIAYSDPVYHDNVLFARPIDDPAVIENGNARLMTATAWHGQPDGTFTGIWHDYAGPAHVPPKLLRRLTIVADLGYLMPDEMAEKLLSGLTANQPQKAEMNVNQAEDYAREVGEPVTARAIRLAADRGYIPGARKVGRDWLIPYEGFNHYLDNRPRRGRKS